MKTVSISGTVNKEIVDEAVQTLRSGNLLCVPCNGSYRFLCDIWNPDAVMLLLQSKRRVKKKPSLVFISDKSQLSQIVESIESLNFELMKAFWPGPLTLLLDPHPELPRKISKELSKANGSLGVRIPVNPLLRRILTAFGGPILASSANRNSKSGETSTEQIRKNFSQNVALFLDAGDFDQSVKIKSTVVEVVDDCAKIVREGLISRELIVDVVGEEHVK